MDFSLTAAEKRILLETARASIASRWGGSAQVDRTDGGPGLSAKCGAFVTLHLGTKLRGCIGRMASPDPLIETVRIMALESAFGDPRFPPLAEEELPRCHIEISVLSPMTACEDLESIRIGVHGVYLLARGRSGVFLPQVPVEQGWNLAQYLDQLCLKAGLPVGVHRAPDAQVFTFTAVVFSEEGVAGGV